MKPMTTRIVMLAVDTNDCDPEGDETVLVCGKAVGYTTSGCFSPALGEGMKEGFSGKYFALYQDTV